ncbi:Iron-sulfur flavoprotein [Sporomusa ovata DSM 2662]|uniref:Iron-sulfur flavoprotein n=1 Tax=Sporomusa ovata TaxID=2378 RepID=A0A0U1KTS7_9FIRM|nr:flavodoxin family protein [Sporomusa ovata]EQB26744.1 NADPH-dependent FMN reductase [Sporomusa ovata DSM 2662]CQR70838.1 Iron-sulfur flavoprotein [Sporomusa ovata]
MVKVLVLLGSPRVHGTNSLVVGEVLRGAAACSEVEVEKVWLNQCKLTPCQACDSCFKTGRCRLQDDMEPVYAAIVAADAVILAAPIYFSGMSAQTKVMIDRCQPFWSAKYIMKSDAFAGKKRPGLFIATGGQPPYEGQFTGSEHVASLFFKMIGVKNIGSLTLPDLDARPLSKRPTDLERAFELGKLLIQSI